MRETQSRNCTEMCPARPPRVGRRRPRSTLCSPTTQAPCYNRRNGKLASICPIELAIVVAIALLLFGTNPLSAPQPTPMRKRHRDWRSTNQAKALNSVRTELRRYAQSDVHSYFSVRGALDFRSTRIYARRKNYSVMSVS